MTERKKNRFLVLTVVLLVGASLLSTTATLFRSWASPMTIGPSYFSERLALAGEFSGPLPFSLEILFEEVSQTLESDGQIRALQKGNSPTAETYERLSPGYKLWADHLARKPGSLNSLKELAYDGLIRLLVAFAFSGALLLVPILGLAITYDDRPSEIRTFEPPSPLAILGIYATWNLTASILVPPLRMMGADNLGRFYFLILVQILSYGVGCCLLWKFWTWREWRPWDGVNWKQITAFYLLLIVVLPSIEFGMEALTGVQPNAVLSLLPYFRNLTNIQGAILLVIALLIGPIFEELMFRGWLLLGLAPKIGSTKALLLSSLLFAAGHGNLWSLPVSFAFALVTGWATLQTKSLGTSIALHVLWNATTLCWVFASI